MSQSAIKSIGVIVKPHQPDALETLCALTRWMSDRGIAFVGLPEIEREQIEHNTGCKIQVLGEAEMPERVDLILVHVHLGRVAVAAQRERATVDGFTAPMSCA